MAPPLSVNDAVSSGVFYQPMTDARGTPTAFRVRSIGLRGVLSGSGLQVHEAYDEASEAIAWRLLWPHAQQSVPVGVGRIDTPDGLPHYREVHYRNIYPGVTLVFHGHAGEVEYDLRLSPGADPSSARLRVHGADALRILPSGDLEILQGGRSYVQRAPVSYQEIGGERSLVPSRYVDYGDGVFGFAVGAYDREHELVIDPVIEKGVRFGGESSETATSLQRDAAGNPYLFGQSLSTQLPGVHPQPSYVWREGAGGYSHFVSKLKPDLSGVQYTATYLLPVIGAGATAVTSGGEPRIAVTYIGQVASFTGPGTPTLLGKGYESTSPSTTDRVLLVGLNAQGTGTRFASLLGCVGRLRVTAIATDASDRTWVAGSAICSELPEGAFRNPEATDNVNAFVARVSADGKTLEKFAVVGGSGNEAVAGFLLDAQGRPVIWGNTTSANFPATAGAFSRTLNGSFDGYIARLNASLTGIDRATLLGGSSTDSVTSLRISSTGKVVVSGSTTSGDFPTTPGAWMTGDLGGSSRTTVARFSEDLGTLEMGTYLALTDGGMLRGLDPSGRLLLYFSSSSLGGDLFDEALLPPLPRSGTTSTVLAVIRADGSGMDDITYLPGESAFFEPEPAGPAGSKVLVVGNGTSPGFPIPETLPPLAPVPAVYSDIWLGVVDLADPTHCTVAVAPATQTIPAAGGAFPFTVTAPSGCPWFATTYFSEAQFTGALSGLGSGAGELTITANPSGYSPRPVTFSVNRTTLTWEQREAGCASQELSPADMAFPAGGGVRGATFSIANGCEWQWSVSQPWVQTTLPPVGIGSPVNSGRSFSVTLPANSFGARTATLTAASRTMAISQGAGACTATVQPGSASVPASGATLQFALDTTGTDCVWQAGIASPGPGAVATVTSAATGLGDSTVTVSVPATPLNVPRTFQLVAGGITVPIQQAAGSCDVTLSPQALDVPISGGDFMLAVSASGTACLWNPTVSAPWVQILSTYGSGSGTLYLRVLPNDTGSSRETTLQLLGRTVPVRQLAGGNVLVTVASWPAGIPLTINGVVYPNPGSGGVQLSLPKGATLRLSAPPVALQTADNEYRFVNWTDNRPREWTFTVPSNQETATYYASYEIYYRLWIPDQMNGRIQVSPAAPDLFYPHNTTVRLTGLPDPGYRFARWHFSFPVMVESPAMLEPTWDLLMQSGVGVTARFSRQFTTPPPAIVTEPLVATMRYALGSTPRFYYMWLRSGTAIANFGLPVVSCGNQQPPFSAGLSDFATPAELDFKILRDIADRMTPGDYPCSVMVPRTDGGSPSQVVFGITFKVLPVGGDPAPRIDAVVNAGSYSPAPLAPGSIATLFGEFLADRPASANTLPLPVLLDELRLHVSLDGMTLVAPLFYVSPGQVNFQIPPSLNGASGATLEVIHYLTRKASIPLQFAPSSPAIFTANADGKGVPAGSWLRESALGRTSGNLFQCPQGGGSCVPALIDLGSSEDRVYLTLYATGIPAAVASTTQVRIGGVMATVTYAGPQGQYEGLQQINVLVPPQLKGRGEVDLQVAAGGIGGNTVRLRF